MQLPAAVQTEQLHPSGMRYVLPRRFAAATQAFGGWVLVPVLLGFVAITVVNVLVAAGLVDANVPDEERLLFLPFALFFGGTAGFLVLYLVPYHFGHAEVEVRDGRLSSVQRAGPLRRSRQHIPIARLERLVLAADPVLNRRYGAAYQQTPGETAICSIRVERSDGKSSVLVADYPRDLLLPLAESICEAVDPARASEIEFGASIGSVVVVDETQDESLPADSDEPPEESNIEVVQRADSVHVNVPPGGVFRGTGGALLTTLVIFAAATVLTAIGMAVAQAHGLRVSSIEGWGYFVLGLAGFIWSILMMAVLSALHMGTCRGILSIGGGRITLDQRSCLGEDHRYWSTEDLRAMRLAASGYTTGSERSAVPQLQLELETTDGKRYGLLPGREEQELKWLGTVVSRQIGIPFEADLRHQSIDYAWNRRAASWQPGWRIFVGGLFLAVAALLLLYSITAWIAPLALVTCRCRPSANSSLPACAAPRLSAGCTCHQDRIVEAKSRSAGSAACPVGLERTESCPRSTNASAPASAALKGSRLWQIGRRNPPNVGVQDTST